MTFTQLYNQALSLRTDKICRIRNGKCIAVRLGIKKLTCDACEDLCTHFKDRCTIKNIFCKVWLCPEMEEFKPEYFLRKQEEILSCARDLGLNKYALTEQEIKGGKESNIKASSNNRLDKYLK